MKSTSKRPVQQREDTALTLPPSVSLATCRLAASLPAHQPARQTTSHCSYVNAPSCATSNGCPADVQDVRWMRRAVMRSISDLLAMSPYLANERDSLGFSSAM